MIQILKTNIHRIATAHELMRQIVREKMITRNTIEIGAPLRSTTMQLTQLPPDFEILWTKPWSKRWLRLGSSTFHIFNKRGKNEPYNSQHPPQGAENDRIAIVMLLRFVLYWASLCGSRSSAQMYCDWHHPKNQTFLASSYWSHLPLPHWWRKGIVSKLIRPRCSRTSDILQLVQDFIYNQ